MNTGSSPEILNEAVNFDLQSVFIAIPKTGTTGVRSQLQQQGNPLIPNPHLNIMQVRDSLYVFLLIRTLGGNQSFPTKTIPGDPELRAIATELFESFFKFSAVRNPWARALSLYQRREGIQVSGDVSFEEFCEHHFYANDTCLHPTRHFSQLDWLCDENGQCIMDYVYKLEEFSEAVKVIEEHTNGRIRLQCRSVNVNPDSEAKNYRERYTKRTKKIIASRFEKDIDFFKYTF